ncbi:MAG: C69 family dipeptidase [Pirellulales bacterium]|nr:C69 family dipeptidase [Pirellulales bacterium]
MPMPRCLLCAALFLLMISSSDDPRGSTALACFAVIAGRDATEDGSVLVGHNEQDRGVRILNFGRVPRQRFASGAAVSLIRGGTVPQASETAAYLWSQCPAEEFSDSYLNEHGVCVVSNRCPTREDDHDALAARGEIRDGGIGLWLRRLVAQRARTAREGVELAGRLVERFGYVDTGRTYTIADPNEAWLFSTVRGRRWAAQRVPDDAVVILPNVHIIGQMDLKDARNFLGSPDLVDYAIARGWYDPAAGRPFDFGLAYREPPEDEPDPRRWTAFCLLTGAPVAWPAGRPVPFAVRPREKLSVAALAAVLRAREGPGPRPISSDTTLEASIFQLRREPPREIGCVWWRVSCEPSRGVMIPWYLGVDDVPAAYRRPQNLAEWQSVDAQLHPVQETFEPDGSLAWWRFRRVVDWVHADYAGRIGAVRSVWAALEDRALSGQREFEAEVAQLFRTDPAAARRRLTQYGAAWAEEAGRAADRLVPP